MTIDDRHEPPTPYELRAEGSIVNRLEQLERDNRRLRRYTTTMLVVMAMVAWARRRVDLVLGAVRPSRISTDRVRPAVRATRRCSGTTRGAWGLGDDGAVRLVLNDEEGRQRVRLSLLQRRLGRTLVRRQRRPETCRLRPAAGLHHQSCAHRPCWHPSRGARRVTERLFEPGVRRSVGDHSRGARCGQPRARHVHACRAGGRRSARGAAGHPPDGRKWTRRQRARTVTAAREGPANESSEVGERTSLPGSLSAG